MFAEKQGWDDSWRKKIHFLTPCQGGIPDVRKIPYRLFSEKKLYDIIDKISIDPLGPRA